jgi:hypothetical protein
MHAASYVETNCDLKRSKQFIPVGSIAMFLKFRKIKLNEIVLENSRQHINNNLKLERKQFITKGNKKVHQELMPMKLCQFWKKKI